MTTSRRAFLAAPSLLAMQGQRRPNILFLLTDDQRWDSLGCMGNRIVRTPNIDRLSRGGVTFGEQFVTTAICVTSRASIFTGQYARCHGVTDFNRQFSAEQLNRIYPVALRHAGYRTGFIGKWGLDKAPAPSDAFDYWAGFLGQGKYFPNGEPGPHLTTIMTSQAQEFLRTCKQNQPFCLSVSFKAPHVQDDDPRQFLYDPADASLYADQRMPVPKTMDSESITKLPLSVQRSEGRRRWGVRFSTPELFQQSVKGYYRLISGIDRSVGTMLGELDKLGLRENTIVIYTGDNGFYLGEHGLAGKWFMHEESIRVPLIMQGPGIASGRRVDAMSLNVDLAPTMLDLAGVPIPDEMQGRSLRPWLEGRIPAWRREWFYEHKFRANGWIPPTEGIRTERWKYTRYPEESPVFEELYDLNVDPLEERNLAAEADHRSTLETLRTRRKVWSDSLDTGRVPEGM
ncbi:sulfatase [uncultured Paludibaculum sp.]|uniref:sulfatase family protein n=1 Tax=uncultured Paludibaculum sp. TaxID=1765020 RepID=UPI002AAB069E|nr:sulfatase [uncultured Paludibaculum sp.]